MKRIATSTTLSGQPCGGAEVRSSTGIRCPVTGWWTPSAVPEAWIYTWKGLAMPGRSGRRVEWLLAKADPSGSMAAEGWRPAPEDNPVPDWGHQIWPDCMD